jgi:hypothetical protein
MRVYIGRLVENNVPKASKVINFRDGMKGKNFNFQLVVLRTGITTSPETWVAQRYAVPLLTFSSSILILEP